MKKGQTPEIIKLNLVITGKATVWIDDIKLIRGPLKWTYREIAMKYQVGELGRVILAHFEDGDPVISNITAIVRAERIEGCIFYLLGGLTEGRIVFGPQNDDVRPPQPTWREIIDSHETLAIGTVFWQGEEPRVHIHGTYGKFDSVKTGCLRDEAKTFLVLEAVILELKGIKAIREMDPDIQVALLKLIK